MSKISGMSFAELRAFATHLQDRNRTVVYFPTVDYEPIFRGVEELGDTAGDYMGGARESGHTETVDEARAIMIMVRAEINRLVKRQATWQACRRSVA